MNFPLNLASGLYRTGYELRKLLYSIGVRHSRQVAKAKIICIGNLSVGGTGKTSFVAFLAQQLCQENYKVAIVSRGYKGSANRKPTIVSNAEKILINNYRLVGDEPLLLARSLNNIPVVIARKRYAAAKLAADTFAPQVILLDDGFQHWGLARDLDIVLLDATDELAALNLLPAGKLREPLSALERAGIVIITKCNLAGSKKCAVLENIVKKHSPQALLIRCELALNGLRKVSEPHKILPAEFLQKKKIVACCSIANPDSFFDMLWQENAEIVYQFEFADHYHYTEADVKKIETAYRAKNADFIVTTEKDWIRLEQLISTDVPYYTLQVAPVICTDDSEKFWNKINTVLLQ